MESSFALHLPFSDSESESEGLDVGEVVDDMDGIGRCSDETMGGASIEKWK